MIAIHLDAGTDNNGNPRRCFMVIDNKGNTRAVLDDGRLFETNPGRDARMARARDRADRFAVKKVAKYGGGE